MDAAKAETYFQRALAGARALQAKSWEQRAATSMARLWRDQGKRDAARDLLAPVYRWFTEGFDTLDLKAGASCCNVILSIVDDGRLSRLHFLPLVRFDVGRQTSARGSGNAQT